MYDWANSVYSLVITTAIFPLYYNAVTTTSENNDLVSFFGIEIVNSVLYSYSLSFSFLLLTIIQPILSGIADYSGNKKFFLRLFMYLGSFSCMSLYFFDGENIEYGIIFSVLASIGFTGSLVFYNAFLPEISTPKNFDNISARGYSFGYIGSVILLIICLALIQGFEFFGFQSSKDATKFTFLLVGFWWILFAQITLFYLPEKHKKIKLNRTILTYGLRELKRVWNYIKGVKNLKLYLLSYFFYSMGVQTIMLVASYFGDKELNLEQSKLIFTILIIQLIAIFGAYFFAFISKLKGNKFSLLIMNSCWIIICVSAYFTTNENQFYFLAAAVGILMGGIQSLSRSTFSKLIPDEIDDNASFFNFYAISYNISVVIGTFSYGYIEQVTGSMRSSILALTLFFIIGLVILLNTKIKK
jgi:UMF1 family MFS transporter